MAGQLPTVQRWLRALGDANIERYPPLAVLAGWVAVLPATRPGQSGGRRSSNAASFDGVPADGSASFDSARAMLRAACVPAARSR